jgi:hypothetical protein
MRFWQRRNLAFLQSLEMEALGPSLCWFGLVLRRGTPRTTFAPTAHHYPRPQQKLEMRKE